MERQRRLANVRNAAAALVVITALAVEVAPKIKVQPQHVEPVCSQLFNPVACSALPETPTITPTQVPEQEKEKNSHAK